MLFVPNFVGAPTTFATTTKDNILKNFNFAVAILATSLTSCLATSAQAAIINPTYVSGFDLNTDGGIGFAPANVTSDSSLSRPVPTGATLAQAQAAVFTGLGNYGSYWETNTTGGSGYFDSHSAPLFVFDVGSVNTISNIVLWNGLASNANQAKEFSLSFSNDGIHFTGTYSGTLAASYSNVEMAQTFALNGISGRYVELELTSNYFGDPSLAGGDRVGLGKVRFDVAVAAVPEPETWAMMLAGMGFIGFTMRRRSKAAVFPA